jgi:hypothetical protein
MLTTAGRFTGQRASGRHVLAIQDTTGAPGEADAVQRVKVPPG